MTRPPFRQRFTSAQRCAEAARVLRDHPDRVPIIVEPRGAEEPPIDKEKFLVPRSLTVAQLLFVVRKRVRLASDQALYLFVSETNTLLCGTETLDRVHERHRSEDGFLYVMYSRESTFG